MVRYSNGFGPAIPRQLPLAVTLPSRYDVDYSHWALCYLQHFHRLALRTFESEDFYERLTRHSGVVLHPSGAKTKLSISCRYKRQIRITMKKL